LSAREEAGSHDCAEELDLLRLLAPQLGQLHGIGAPDVVQTYRRAIELTAGLPNAEANADTEFSLLWGLDGCHLVHGDLTAAARTGDRMAASAIARRSGDHLMLARRRNAIAQLLQGNVIASITLNVAVLAHYREDRHAKLRYTHLSDQRALALAYLAWSEAIAGLVAAAAKHSRMALRAAERLKHPYTSAHVLCKLATVAQTLGDPRAASALADAGQYLSNRHGFTYWVACADLVLGWCKGRRSPAAGVSAIEQAIDRYLGTGSEQALPYAFVLLTESALAAGDPPKAAQALAECSRAVERLGIRLYAAEILRLRAETEAMLGSAQPYCTGLLDEAVRIATQQRALMFVTRAQDSVRRLFSTPESAR